MFYNQIFDLGGSLKSVDDRHIDVEDEEGNWLLNFNVLFLNREIGPSYYSSTESFDKMLKVKHSLAAISKCYNPLSNVHVIEIHNHSRSVKRLIVCKDCEIIIPS